MKKDLPQIFNEFGVRSFYKKPDDGFVIIPGSAEESLRIFLAVPKDNYKPLMEALEARHA